MNKRVLQVHNFYDDTSGENLSVEDERTVLESNGHVVERFEINNSEYKELSKFQKLLKPIWNRDAGTKLAELAALFKPDIIHITNTFPLIGWSVYRVRELASTPIVQSVRNYRFACPNGLLYRDNHICHDCRNRRIKWPCAVNRCYGASYTQSIGAALHSSIGATMQIWKKRVDAFIALSPIVERILVEDGFDPKKIVIKANTVLGFDDRPNISGERDGAIYAGRLDCSKGLATLLKAWDSPELAIGLTIIGDGEMRDTVQNKVTTDNRILWAGKLSHPDVLERISKAKFVVFPSEWYETFGRTILEAFAMGVPVIASRLGAMESLVKDGVNGFMFSPGDEADLRRCVRKMERMEQSEYQNLSRSARETFEAVGKPCFNYEALLKAFTIAHENRKCASVAR